MTTIYALCDPVTGEIRYVGKTITSLPRRLDCHVRGGARGVRDHRANWIRSLPATPVMRTLCVVPDSFGAEMETRAIAAFRAKGYRLTNQTAGGEGAPGLIPSEETRERMAAAHRGRKRAPDSIAKTAAAHRGRKYGPEVRARMSRAASGRRVSADACAKMRGRRHRPESIELMRAAKIGHLVSPETREKQRAGRLGCRHSSEAKAKIAAAKRGKPITAEHRARIGAGLIGNKNTLGHKASPELRAKLSAIHRARWARIKSGM